MSDAVLNPAQQALLEQIRTPAGAPRFFKPGFVAELRSDMEAQLAPLATALTEIDADGVAASRDQLFLSKSLIERVLGCESKFLADDAVPFEWSIPIAKGTLAHRAIELIATSDRVRPPLELIDEAMARMQAEGTGLGGWLALASAETLAEIRGATNNLVLSFCETWPPLKRRWMPAVEFPLRAEFCGGTIVCGGKPDITLGTAHGHEARKVIVDLKTGARRAEHRLDLRFYALLDTFRVGTPPRLLVSYYLDQGQLESELVTEALLEATVDRVVDAAHRVVDLRRERRAPSTAPGTHCRWCPLNASCPDAADLSRSDSD